MTESYKEYKSNIESGIKHGEAMTSLREKIDLSRAVNWS